MWHSVSPSPGGCPAGSAGTAPPESLLACRCELVSLDGERERALACSGGFMCGSITIYLYYTILLHTTLSHFLYCSHKRPVSVQEVMPEGPHIDQRVGAHTHTHTHTHTLASGSDTCRYSLVLRHCLNCGMVTWPNSLALWSSAAESSKKGLIGWPRLATMSASRCEGGGG